MHARVAAGIAIGTLLTLAWAAWAYGKNERAHRGLWTNETTDVGAQPYRSSARVDRAHAPLLVRTTAFLCIWVGQLVAGVMIIPSFFMRPVATSMNASQPGSTVSVAMLVYSLGPNLLARHVLIEAHVMAARSLLHTIAGALALFSAFGLAARGEAGPWLFYVLLVIAALSIVVSMMLSRMLDAHGSAFRPKTDA